MNRYQRYLRSRHWRKRRAEFAKTHAYRCPCGADQKLDLHHKTYERFGAEKDSDLMWLCRRCHTLVEQLIDEGQLDRACEGFFARERRRSAQPVTAPSIVAARERRAEIVLAVERARKEARRGGDVARQRKIEEFSRKYEVRY